MLNKISSYNTTSSLKIKNEEAFFLSLIQPGSVSKITQFSLQKHYFQSYGVTLLIFKVND